MNLMSQVLELSKRAGICDNMVARRMLNISRATMYTWSRGTVAIPDDRVFQLETLKKTIQAYLDDGTLPTDRNDLTWYGLIHLTECQKNKD